MVKIVWQLKILNIFKSFSYCCKGFFMNWKIYEENEWSVKRKIPKKSEKFQRKLQKWHIAVVNGKIITFRGQLLKKHFLMNSEYFWNIWKDSTRANSFKGIRTQHYLFLSFFELNLCFLMCQNYVNGQVRWNFPPWSL